MTRPIYEPAEQRQIAALGFDKNQLQRRPAPLVSGGFPYPWVRLHDGATTIPHNTTLPVPFDLLDYDPALVTKGDIFDWSIVDTGDPGVDRFQLETSQEGFYFASLIALYDQTTTNGTEAFAYMRVNLRAYNFSFTTFFLNLWDSQDWMRDDVGGAVPSEAWENPYLNITDIFYLAGARRIFLCEGRQTTGIDRGLEGTELFVAYLGSTDATTWVQESV